MGADNNLSPKNAPELYNLFKTADCFRGYFQWLEHSIQVWNAHIAARQLKNLAATIGALQSSWDNESLRSNLVEKLNRSQKIVTNIANDSLQMVFADTGLMSCILATGRAAVQSGKVTSCKLSFDPKTGYTKLEEGRGTVAVIQGLDKALLIKSFCNSLS